MLTLNVDNIKCGGCAHTIEGRVEKAFGAKPTVDVEKGEVRVDLPEDQRAPLTTLLHSLGYPVAGDVHGTLDRLTTQAKSVVSCAVGRITS